MKKLVFLMVIGGVLFTACNKNNPEAQKLPPGNAKVAASKIITIPVVVNVLYKSKENYNIHDIQIKSQIDVLNEAFSGTNVEYPQIPEMFKKVAAGDVGIRFVLQKVVRKQTTKNWEIINDSSLKIPAQGGIKATNPTTALNIWLYPWEGDINYLYKPKVASSPELDGIVMSSLAFGRIGYRPKNIRRKGRTLVFFVGAWLNLLPLNYTPLDSTRDFCYRADDEVDDTPASYDTFDCPAFPAKNECTGEVMMTMNYMDFASDDCRYMFTVGQKKRMLAALAKGGLRASFNK